MTLAGDGPFGRPAACKQTPANIAMNHAADRHAGPSTLLAGGTLDGLRVAAAIAILLVIFLTFAPFADLSDPKLLEPSTGNETASYLALISLAGFAGFLLISQAPLLLSALNRNEYLLLAAWLVLSVVLSVDPMTSAKRLVLSANTFALAAMLPWLVPGTRQLTTVLTVMLALVLGLCWFGVMAVPHLAIHQPQDIVEPEIAGGWRGIFGHKNIAASVMAVFVFIGWFIARNGRPLAGSALAAAALTFLVFTHGKSALGMLVLAGAIAVAVDRARPLPLRFILAFGPLALLNFATVGSATSAAIRSVVQALPVDATFTGRTEIWRFAIDAIHARPWTGHGFEAFWYTAILRNGDDSTVRWMGDVASSHNSYVELVLTIGIPGLLLVILALLILPLRDFHAARARQADPEFVRLLLALWLFSLYAGTFEAFIFSRASPMWFVMALAVSGLRWAANYDIRR